MKGNDGAPTAFRVSERKYRYYKKRKVEQDYSDVLDFRRYGESSSIRLVKKLEDGDRELSVFTIDGKDGFLFIPQALTIKEQGEWALRTLSDYSEAPNYSNLSMGSSIKENLWKAGDMDTLDKLRWVTLGYHFNWTTNMYENCQERISEFPPELVDLCGKHAGWCDISNFQPQAGIINYYKVNQSMMKAHQDKAEFTFDHPIFSYSLGNSSIFLLGDTCRSNPPVPIWLRSGDLMIMGGKSRVYFHGIARTMPGTSPSELLKSLSNQGIEGEKLSEYLKEYRINMNIRQVFPEG